LPIDQLPRDAGGLAPLLPVVTNLLRELRRQRAEMTKLDTEMRQRVAQRTDALERQLGQLNAQATRDVLTGLYNRRMLDQCLEDLVRRNVESREPLCLLMIDVDDFKVLNDTLGHAAGDSLLKAIGQLIRSSVRGDDLPFRFGGDEFVIVLPRAGRVEGDALAKRLGDLVDALTRSLAVPRKPRLSMGISTLADLIGVATAADLMRDADKRLYAAKAARKQATAATAGQAA
jgi:diguanylate cyclase (GGDEF)-like protein